METSDPALVKQAREGDLEAFGELFQATHRRIYNFVRNMIRNPEDAADLTQKVYVSAWRNLSSLHANEAFLVWLHQIALNAVRDQAKRYQPPVCSLESSGNSDGSPAPLQVADQADDPAQTTAKEDEQRCVREAIRELPEIHRSVVTMHHIEGLDVSEVASVLGVPSGTVLSRLARAREALQRKLAPLLKTRCL